MPSKLHPRVSNFTGPKLNHVRITNQEVHTCILSLTQSTEYIISHAKFYSCLYNVLILRELFSIRMLYGIEFIPSKIVLLNIFL